MGKLGDVWFVDVGQGHATLVVAGDSSIIVDCPSRGSVEVVNLLRDSRVSKLTSAIVTHRDLDHCGGMRTIVEAFHPSGLFINAAWTLPRAGRQMARVRAVLKSLFSAADVLGVECEALTRGDQHVQGPIRWDVLAPTHRGVLSAALDNNTNRFSAVLRITLDDKRFLVTGDIDNVAITELVASGMDLAADVLLIPHHGADNTRLGELVAAVDPKYTIISAGRTAGIHPTPGTLSTLVAGETCRIMCTQVNAICHPTEIADSACAGTIKFTVGDDGLSVVPSLAIHQERIDMFDSAACRRA